jgi:hypothetical protein
MHSNPQIDAKIINISTCLDGNAVFNSIQCSHTSTNLNSKEEIKITIPNVATKKVAGHRNSASSSSSKNYSTAQNKGPSLGTTRAFGKDLSNLNYP